MRANLKNKETIGIENPWTGSNAKRMTWAEIVAWGKDSIHPNNLNEWIKKARQAFTDNDERQLGIMIIGS